MRPSDGEFAFDSDRTNRTTAELTVQNVYRKQYNN